MASKSIVMNSEDNIATTLSDITKGEEVEVEIKGDAEKIQINDDIPFGHKFSLVDIKKGSDVVKYIMFLSPSKRFPKVFCSNLNYAH